MATKGPSPPACLPAPAWSVVGLWGLPRWRLLLGEGALTVAGLIGIVVVRCSGSPDRGQVCPNPDCAESVDFEIYPEVLALGSTEDKQD
ncbi:MAG TPA: hypothetical protein ENI80_09770 [Acidiferrobacteraceae bacterium]|nr:hypothetical protein [Acidiferrobacteraceae bacterium]